MIEPHTEMLPYTPTAGFVGDPPCRFCHFYKPIHRINFDKLMQVAHVCTHPVTMDRDFSCFTPKPE